MVFLAIVMALVFAIHSLFITQYNQLLIKSYWVNYLMAVIVYSLLILASKKFSEQLGFMYMGGSFIKFFIFFLILKPSYTAVGLANKTGLVYFFIPYIVAVFMETKMLAKILNKT